MELPGDEEGVLGYLDDLHQLFLGPDARDAQAVLLERLQVVVVDLVAMTMALADDALAVEARGAAALAEEDRVQAEPHGSALVRQVALLGQEVDDQMRCAG